MKEFYKRAWRFLKECRNYIIFVSALFLASAFLGFFYPKFFTEIIKNLIDSLVKKTSDMNFWQLFLFIFENNLSTAFFGMSLGIIFGIMPLVLCFFNGYVLGFVMNKSAEASGAGVLFRLLPHGIFELPALAISLGVGLRLGMFLFFEKKKKKKFFRNIKDALVVFIFVILPLLLIAALIEAGAIAILG